MRDRKKVLEALEQKRNLIARKQALIGFDGFIDRIKVAVNKRFGAKEDFTKISNIQGFATRINDASGIGTNIELYLQQEKMGGNGPILANALHKSGLETRYIGALGVPQLHPVFESFARDTHAISIANPGITDAVEFNDGKIFFGEMSGLEQVTYENILAVMEEGPFLDVVSRSHLLAMVNWTMLPYMNTIFSALLEKVLPCLPTSEARYLFFDLADPAKRSDGDLKDSLALIKRFGTHGHVILGLNLKEALHISSFLPSCSLSSKDDLKKIAQLLYQWLELQTVVVHSPQRNACATKNEAYVINTPFCAKPIVTTGAGDHFNAGFCLSQLIGLNTFDSLTIATAFASYYVTTGKTPDLNAISDFISIQEDKS